MTDRADLERLIASARADALREALAIIRKASWDSGAIDLPGWGADEEIIQPILALIDKPAE